MNHELEHHLRAAEGWLELGNHLEADAELDCIAPALRVYPSVLELRWQIYAASKKWHACIDIAKALTKLKPNRALGWIHHAYALHELERTKEAFEVLSGVAGRFPKESTVAYNLACYTCQLGRLGDAGDWLAKAYELGNATEIKLRALKDPDLEPLWRNSDENSSTDLG